MKKLFVKDRAKLEECVLHPKSWTTTFGVQYKRLKELAETEYKGKLSF